MTVLRVSEAVGQGFPRLRIAAVVARGFGGHEPWPETDAGLVALETTESAAFGPAVDAAAADLAARAATRSRQVSTRWLTPGSPVAPLGDRGHLTSR
jgi:hypothetical protein